MIRIKPDVLITIAWCVFGMTYRMLPIELNHFREISLLLLIISSRKKIRLEKTHLISLVFCIYYFAVSAYHEGIGFLQPSLSMVSWIVTLIAFTAYSKEKEDINLLIKIIIYTSAIVGAVLLLNNRLFSNEINVNLNSGVIVNRNSVLYYIFPGYLFQLLKIEKTKQKKVIDYVLLFVLLFACLQINSRTMYLSLIISSLLILNKKILGLVNRKRIFGLIFLVIFLVASIYSIFKLLPEEYISREFTNGIEIGDANRITLWKEAIGMVKNPIFGMGPSYYEKHVSYSFGDYGAHNIFIDIYVSVGIIGSLLFMCMLIPFIKKNLYILAIIIPAITTFMVEAGRIFFPYMMLIIAWFIFSGAKNNNVTIDEYLVDIFNLENKNVD